MVPPVAAAPVEAAGAPAESQRVQVPQVVPASVESQLVTPDVPPKNVDTHSGGMVNVTWVQEGASVLCAWRKEDGAKARWYAATIVRLNADGTVRVKFTSSGCFCDEVDRGDLRKAAGAEAEGGINLLPEFDGEAEFGVPPGVVTAEAAAAAAEAAAAAAEAVSAEAAAATAVAAAAPAEAEEYQPRQQPNQGCCCMCVANQCMPLARRAHGVPVAKGRCIRRSVAAKWFGRRGPKSWHASHVSSSGQAKGHGFSDGLRQAPWQLVGK